MNIRKIIKEELDSFDWAESVVGGDVHVGTCLYWVLEPHKTLTVIELADHRLPKKKQIISLKSSATDDAYVLWSPIVLSKYLKNGELRICDNERVNESEFDWADEVPLPDISLGTKIKTTTGNIYTVVSTNDKSIFYTIEKGPQIDKSNRIGSIDYDKVKDLVDRGRWKIIS